MSYNGSGTFNINTSGQPVVSGTLISSTAFNALTADLATGLSTAITKDGQTTVSANIPLNGFKITGLGGPSVAGDAISYGSALGTPSSATLTNATGLPISTGVSGLGSGVATFLGTPSSANLASAVTDETGSGALVFATSPTLVTPALGTPSSLVGTNITGTAPGLTAGNVTTNANLTGPITSVGNATAVAAQTGTGSTFVMQNSPTLVTPALGTPASGVVTNLTGTASININGTVGATTPTTGAFTTVAASSTVSDAAGNVRSIIQNSQTSAYVLVVGDNGKHISITTGGVTVPASVFSAGQVVTIFNNSGSNQTITQGASVTLRQAGTANTGNRTLAQYGVCTVLCVNGNTFVISGAGLT